MIGAKGGFKSEDVKGFLNLQKYIPFFYPKLFHPVHGNDEILICFDIYSKLEKYCNYEM